VMLFEPTGSYYLNSVFDRSYEGVYRELEVASGRERAGF